MRVIVHKTAYSTTIQESQDFSAAIFEKTDNALSFAHGVSAHVGGLAKAARMVVKKFEDDGEELNHGDVLVFDDPYWGGSHTCDATILGVVTFEDLTFLPV